jgi:hypothetical protein
MAQGSTIDKFLGEGCMYCIFFCMGKTDTVVGAMNYSHLPILQSWVLLNFDVSRSTKLYTVEKVTARTRGVALSRDAGDCRAYRQACLRCGDDDAQVPINDELGGGGGSARSSQARGNPYRHWREARKWSSTHENTYLFM